MRPRFFLRPILALVLAATWLAPPAPASKPAGKAPETRVVETVAPGVEHVIIRRGDFSEKPEADRWTIHALVLDPSRVRLELGRAMDEGVGTETVSSLAARHAALAAVNGGYFRTTGLLRGEPAGLLEVAGRVLSEPSRQRPGLAVMNAAGGVRVAVVTVDFRAEVVSEGGVAKAVDGVNRPRGSDELILFTPEFHRTTLTGPGGVEALVVGGLVVVVRSGQGSAAIPDNGCVLSASGEAGNWLSQHVRAGGTVTLKTAAVTRPELDVVPDFIIGGGPVLVREGKPAAASDQGAYDQGFSLKRHPRTAVGVRADGKIILLAVDGRQPARSVGMTIAELEALMIEFGAVEALNLDGGGSTTMAIKGRVVNSPSDASGERPVSDALLVFLR
jgi:exopolysaccharide biosynthesis protein